MMYRPARRHRKPTEKIILGFLISNCIFSIRGGGGEGGLTSIFVQRDIRTAPKRSIGKIMINKQLLVSALLAKV